jgi:glycolate oxidase
MHMPEPNPGILSKRSRIVARLQALLPGEAVIHDEAETRAYECDALTAYRCPPMVVVLPATTDEVAGVLRICHEEGVPVVPRGSGTSLAGGAMPTADCVILGVARLREVLEVDLPNRAIRVQAGITNLAVTRRGRGRRVLLRPRPVEPAGLRDRGQHRDEFGRRALPEIRGDDQQPAGRDHGADGRHRGRAGRALHGCGRAGPPGRRLRVRGAAGRRHRGLAQDPAEARGGAAGADRVRFQRGRRGLRVGHHQGGRPAGGDRVHGPALHPRHRGVRGRGLPGLRGAPDRRGRGQRAEIDEQLGLIRQIAAKHDPVEFRESGSEAESARIWLGRKSAFGAMGQIGDYMCLDGTIPVSALPVVLKRIGEMSRQYGLDVANVFHAGDGNMHPLILFDANKPGDLETCEAFGAEILKLCVEVGGCLTGEHGVGVEKRDLMAVQFDPADLEAQMRVKDVFDPRWLLNPAKVFPLAASAPRRTAA